MPLDSIKTKNLRRCVQIAETITYAAITIGPIYDTISLTSSPAGLWAASYLFSHISRWLCEMIVTEGLANSAEDIFSPFYPTDDEQKKGAIIKIDGIGRYHDRIIFKPAEKQTVLCKLLKLFDCIAEEIAKPFNDNGKDYTEWFKQYLQLHAICFESEGNPILDCSQYLDAIELEKTFPASGGNPLADLLDSSDENRNIIIRNRIRKTFSRDNWPFREYKTEKGEERLPDMKDITGRRAETARPRRKINSYYAIVQTDGDKFGEYIKGCRERGEKVRDFSKKCLDYCSASAKLVQEYGGVPIYAGGDDLLFIAPLTEKVLQKNGAVIDGQRNLIGLLVDLRKEFEKAFWRKPGDPTLSLGIAIRYYKYPLYEALFEAYDMLFHHAKEDSSGCNVRNAAAISLQKHSGRAAEFILKDFSNTDLTGGIQALIKRSMDDDLLRSIKSKIWEFEPLFLQALHISGDALKNLFGNTFDNEEHNAKWAGIELVGELLKALHGASGDDSLKQLDSLLCFAEFWGEEGDDEDA